MSCLFPFKKEKHPGPIGPPPSTDPGPVQPSTPSAGSVWDPPMITSEFCGWANPNPYITLMSDGSEQRAVPGSQAPNRLPWAAMQTRDRIPALGEYDERDPAVSIWRDVKMAEALINVRCIQVEHSHLHTGKGMPWDVALDSTLMNSWTAINRPAQPRTMFCLSWWDVMTGPEGQQYFVNELRGNRQWNDSDLANSQRVFARRAGELMKSADYYRIDGKPVLYRGWAHTLDFYNAQFGFGLTPRAITNIWRDEIRSITGVEPYLVATAMDPDQHKDLKAWGFNCLTQYLLHGKGWSNTMDVYRGWWARDLFTCREQKIDYIVPISAGYKGEAWNTGEWQNGFTHIPTAAEFKQHVIEGRKLARDNRDVCRAVGSYAWSEFGEGGAIEPLQDLPNMLHVGDEMIRAHREAVLSH